MTTAHAPVSVMPEKATVADMKVPAPASVRGAGQKQPGLARRFWSHPWVTQYHRLFVLVVLLNAWILMKGVGSEGWFDAPSRIPFQSLANLAMSNFAAAILIRQQRVVNALFWIATRIPTSAPLWLRWQCAKVFHFGGIHTASATWGTVWFALLFGGQVWHAGAGGQQVSMRTLVLGSAILPLLLTT